MKVVFDNINICVIDSSEPSNDIDGIARTPTPSFLLTLKRIPRQFLEKEEEGKWIR